MSNICPLCGKEKLDESLFCNDCIRKIKNEYEVDVPEILNGEINLFETKPINDDLIETKETNKSEITPLGSAPTDTTESPAPTNYIPKEWTDDRTINIEEVHLNSQLYDREGKRIRRQPTEKEDELLDEIFGKAQPKKKSN